MKPINHFIEEFLAPTLCDIVIIYRGFNLFFAWMHLPWNGTWQVSRLAGAGGGAMGWVVRLLPAASSLGPTRAHWRL